MELEPEIILFSHSETEKLIYLEQYHITLLYVWDEMPASFLPIAGEEAAMTNFG